MSSAFAGWLKFLFAGDFLTVFVWTPFWNSNFSIYVFVGGWSGFLIKSALYFLLIVEFYCLTHFVLWRFTSRKKCYYDRSNNFSTNLLVRETSKNIQYKNGRKTIVKILNLLKLIDVYRYRNIDTDALMQGNLQNLPLWWRNHRKIGRCKTSGSVSLFLRFWTEIRHVFPIT